MTARYTEDVTREVPTGGTTMVFREEWRACTTARSEPSQARSSMGSPHVPQLGHSDHSRAIGLARRELKRTIASLARIPRSSHVGMRHSRMLKLTRLLHAVSAVTFNRPSIWPAAEWGLRKLQMSSSRFVNLAKSMLTETFDKTPTRRLWKEL